ncbi:hypothetical protein EDO6_02554 [Paenibacillus xylanexedens]|nr:hypothetical protein EDO6_02554 [Paenibacillus xylanexedens]
MDETIVYFFKSRLQGELVSYILLWLASYLLDNLPIIFFRNRIFLYP